MKIPWKELDAETLNNLIEHFVLREGTDYGEQEASLTDKVAGVRQQLEDGLAIIVYSEELDSIDIKPTRA